MRNNRGVNNVLSLLVATLFFTVSISVLLGAELVDDSLLAKNLPKITLIIDDVGNNHLLGLRSAQLPSEVALSILPHTRFSDEIANLAHHRGMDILLHQPMESTTNVNLLGPGPLLKHMERKQFDLVLHENLKAVPFVIGLNNHMGSLLTTDKQKMNWLMEELKQRQLFFIDSRTTTETIAESTALLWQVPTERRKVFLDHLDEPKAIAKQFKRLLNIAKKNGYAIAIGHPRENTLDFLEEKLAALDGVEFTLVPVSQLIKNLSIKKQASRASSYVNCLHFDLKNFNYPLSINPQLMGSPVEIINCLVH
ncbi:MAG: polysaccharide deacetylase 2 family uncharacterized protein YibQ [Enterobacterales bacterium]|jgi:polysaccharide deacetylase 2 family uncharacterized protein YibQ